MNQNANIVVLFADKKHLSTRAIKNSVRYAARRLQYLEAL